MERPPAEACTGLVLGGGGARGAAHIGVLRELERQRIPICAIAGTSMGAVVGALYASGRSPDQIEAILNRLDWADLFRDAPPRARLPMRRKDAQLNYRLELEAGWRDGGLVLPYGAVQGQKLGLLLQSLFDGTPRDFDRLPIPFRAVATDIVDGTEVVPASGNLADAVRASMAVPAVFAPMEIDGRLLVDGGLVNNVPVSVVRAMGATRVIAVDVGSPLFTRDQLRTPAAVAFQMVSVLMKERTERALATLGAGDLLLSPALGDFSAADFAGAAATIPAGETAARAAAPALAAFAAPQAWMAWRDSTRRIEDEPRQIDFVDVDATRSGTAELVRDRTRGLVGQPLEVATIEPFVSAAFAEGTYQTIGWRSASHEGRDGILLTPVDKPWGPVFASVGLQFADDFAGRSDYQLVSELLFTGLSESGGELRSLLRLGRVTELALDWFSPLDGRREYYLGMDAGWRAQNLPIAPDGGSQTAEYRVKRAQLGLRMGMQKSPRWSLESGLWLGRHEATPLVAAGGLPDAQEDTIAWGVRAAWDTLDRLSFPSSGARVVMSAQHFPGGWNNDGSGSVMRLRGDWALSSGRHHWLLGGRWATTWGDPPGLAAYSTLGGFLNLSGKLERSLVQPHLAYGRLVYYARLGGEGGLLSVPPYIGASLEAGNTWPTRAAMSAGDLVKAGSVFVGISSPFGPLLLGYGRSNDGGSSWTLSFGNLIRSDDQ
jgi:NTE family protein